MKIDKLVFVGSGHRGKLYNQIAQRAEIKVECFFDNNDEMVGKSINNVQVKKPQNIVDAIFVLTVYGYEKELREQLLGLGIHNENIISVNQFVSLVVEHIDIKEKSSDMKCNITDYPDTIQFPITYKCNFKSSLLNIKSTNIINEIAIASVFSPTIKEKTTVITSNKTIGSNIPLKKILIKLSFFFLGKIFLPFSNNLF